jgi:hypothetical protein
MSRPTYTLNASYMAPTDDTELAYLFPRLSLDALHRAMAWKGKVVLFHQSATRAGERPGQMRAINAELAVPVDASRDVAFGITTSAAIAGMHDPTRQACYAAVMLHACLWDKARSDERSMAVTRVVAQLFQELLPNAYGFCLNTHQDANEGVTIAELIVLDPTNRGPVLFPDP